MLSTVSGCLRHPERVLNTVSWRCADNYEFTTGTGGFVMCSLATNWLCDETLVWRVDWWRHDRVTRWPCDELTGSLQHDHFSVFVTRQSCSVTCCYCVKMTQVTVSQSMLYGSVRTLVCWCQRTWWNFRGVISTRTPNTGFYKVGNMVAKQSACIALTIAIQRRTAPASNVGRKCNSLKLSKTYIMQPRCVSWTKRRHRNKMHSQKCTTMTLKQN